MINRVLIRIKVVQMLYSYMLTRSEFKIDNAPESASRDKRFAYKVYTDLMLLLIELSGFSVKRDNQPLLLSIDKKLQLNRVGRALNSTPAIRQMIAKGSDIAQFDAIAQQLHNEIVSSSVFADYRRKRKLELADDVLLWTVVMETIIGRSPEVESAFRQDPEFTVQGFRMGLEQVVNTLRNYSDTRQLLAKAKSDLDESLDKAYELYLWILSLIVDITREQERRLENAKSKLIVSSDDLNPNTRLIDNLLVKYLQDNESLASLQKEYKIMPATETTALVKDLLDQILASDIYKDYLASKKHDLASDCEFWRDVLRTIVLPSDALAEDMEDKSVYWNDDLQNMGTFVLKTLRRIAQSNGEKVDMLPKFKDHDDEEFGPELFRCAVENQDSYREYIDRFIEPSHWDPKRLAFMDIVIMTAAIAEIINFQSIPVAVSVNEYVEIANDYSTDKSGGFVNGLLYSIVNYLREQGIVYKP